MFRSETQTSSSSHTLELGLLATLQVLHRVRVHLGGQRLRRPSGTFEQHDALVHTWLSCLSKFGVDDLEGVTLLQG